MISVIWEQTYTTSFTLIGVNLNIHLSYIGTTLDNADDPVGIWYLTEGSMDYIWVEKEIKIKVPNKCSQA